MSEVNNRKAYLIRQLLKLEIYQSRDGRPLRELSLYSLEWMHVEERNKAAKAFGDAK